MKKNEKELDWDKVIKTAKEWKLEHVLYLTLRLVQRIFENKIPDEILSGLRTVDYEESLVDHVIDKVFRFEQYKFEYNLLWNDIERQRGFISKLVLLFHLVFLSKDEMRLRYRMGDNEPVTIFLYLRRAGELLKRNRYYPVTMLKNRTGKNDIHTQRKEMRRLDEKIRGWV